MWPISLSSSMSFRSITGRSFGRGYSGIEPRMRGHGHSIPTSLHSFSRQYWRGRHSHSRQTWEFHRQMSQLILLRNFNRLNLILGYFHSLQMRLRSRRRLKPINISLQDFGRHYGSSNIFGRQIVIFQFRRRMFRHILLRSIVHINGRSRYSLSRRMAQRLFLRRIIHRILLQDFSRWCFRGWYFHGRRMWQSRRRMCRFMSSPGIISRFISSIEISCRTYLVMFRLLWSNRQMCSIYGDLA